MITGKPFREDLLAATWLAGPLTEEERARCAAAGVWAPDAADAERWPVFAALTRQALAAAEDRS